jgi:transposase
MHQAELEDCRRSGVTNGEHAELRRELRVTKMEVEILKRFAAYFAKENVLP